MKRFKTNRLAVVVATVALTGASFGALAASDKADQPSLGEEMSRDFSNGWHEGKVETAFLFNTELNNFTLDSEVHGDTVVLTGEVDSDVKKDLAEEIALSIDGINEVENRIMVVKDLTVTEEAKQSKNEFLSAVEDASISAKVKMKLLVNDNLSAMDISVDTEAGVVTLTGEVPSTAAKSLAEAIAGNIEQVQSVDNKLEVAHS